ncbi:MAG TPA: hypothetical protein VF789_07680 [Thermoanaerobaculia bacterium]
MRHRVHRSFTLAGLLILSLVLGCKGDSDVETSGPAPNAPAPPPAPAPGAPPPRTAVNTGWRLDQGLLGASRTIRETKDVKSAQQQYQAVFDAAHGSGDADLERGALLGLARTDVCLGDKDAAARKYEELWSAPAAGEPDLTLFWDALSSGFSYSGMGNDAKAREAFQKAVQAIDGVPEKQDWFAAARLFPQWMLARAGDAAAKAEVEKGLASYKGTYKGPQVTFLKLEKANLQGCGLERPAADIEAFARDLGLDQDPFWTSAGLPTRAR